MTERYLYNGAAYSKFDKKEYLTTSIIKSKHNKKSFVKTPKLEDSSLLQ